MISAEVRKPTAAAGMLSSTSSSHSVSGWLV